ncbi:MAG: hypothetical protein IIW93_03840 [Bacteroidaceae bacterium]|nr:hypothetical protein [Bacteroidaceae bacterium]
MKEIEELKLCEQKDGKLDLTQDDGLEYLVKLADELWPFVNPYFKAKYDTYLRMKRDWDKYKGGPLEETMFLLYDTTNEDLREKLKKDPEEMLLDRDRIYKPSSVPFYFQKYYFDNQIDNTGSSIYSENMFIQGFLKELGLDPRKFWYLCLAVKWQAYLYRKNGILQTTVEKEYDSLINFLSYGKCGLTIQTKDEKNKLKINNEPTLALIRFALEYYRNHDHGIFSAFAIGSVYENKKPCNTQIVAYFTAVMDHFLKAYIPEGKPLEIICNKFTTRDLIAWMVYILEVDLLAGKKTGKQLKNRERFYSEGRTFLRKHIKSYIKKVDPKEFYLG